ncbi:unnamed protein product [Peronospora belbahrii]|uniref:Uncharacterized protein n=1 Tax=Peronospora belbahrii TaxID=622444 RepID=A0ABN8D8K8_9STRA|nr:unnamed protein product [Peronospora belbahrii]
MVQGTERVFSLAMPGTGESIHPGWHCSHRRASPASIGEHLKCVIDERVAPRALGGGYLGTRVPVSPLWGAPAMGGHYHGQAQVKPLGCERGIRTTKCCAPRNKAIQEAARFSSCIS